MKARIDVGLIVKRKRVSPIEISFYALEYEHETKSFTPLHINTLPQYFFDKKLTKITKKMKGFKLLETRRKAEVYV